MRASILVVLSLILSSTAWADQVYFSDYGDEAEFDVRFTNPQCETYWYDNSSSDDDEKVWSNGGWLLEYKPEGTFCTHDDAYNSARRPSSPEYKMMQWIKKAKKQVWMMYLSFSRSTVKDALCEAIDRGVEVTMVLHEGTRRTRADQVEACGGNVIYRGEDPGIDYSHNKFFTIDPDEDWFEFAFSSGNLSSGTVLHHENWNFLKVPKESFLAEIHKCMMTHVVDNGEHSRDFKREMKKCRRNIPYAEEEDVKVSFIPGEGNTATGYIEQAANNSGEILIAAHRFSYGSLIDILWGRLSSSNPPGVYLIVDDDVHWVFRDMGGLDRMPNTPYERRKIRELRGKGMEVRYMETNHWAGLLHHNKFMAFLDWNGDYIGVFTGAGNFTGTAFSSNFENFYYVTIPEVVQAYQEQHYYMWDYLASDWEWLPQSNVMPKI